MFGHIETPDELAEHMRVVRELQDRTGGFTEFVPLSFIPFQTLLGRTHGIAEISREENLKHTAVFRLALGKTIPSLQASWVKMGLDAATEALRWGVNDLGGTLMEESISRMAGADHGVKLDPGGPRRRRPPRRPPGGRAHDALRHPPALRPRRRRVKLELGPLLRHAGTDEATVWVQTSEPVHGRGPPRGQARGVRADVHASRATTTRSIHVTELPADTATPYEVALDGEVVWPEPDSRVPAERPAHAHARGPGAGSSSAPAASPRRTSRRTRCARTSTPTGARSTRCAGSRCAWRTLAPEEWPHALLLLGDQVYADEVHPHIEDELDGDGFVETYDDYVKLYIAAWGEPVIRWLLSTVPSAMIFDDHDVHDDWNTSIEWVTEMRQKAWWRRRIVAAFESYLIYQHLGNLSPTERADFELYEHLRTAEDPTPRLREFAKQADEEVAGHALELLPRHRPRARRDDRLARRPRARSRATARWSTPTSGAGSRSTRAATSTTC